MFKVKLLFLTVAFMTFPSLTLAQDSNELPFVSPAEVGMSAEKLAKVDAAMDELVNQKQIPRRNCDDCQARKAGALQGLWSARH